MNRRYGDKHARPKTMEPKKKDFTMSDLSGGILKKG